MKIYQPIIVRHGGCAAQLGGLPACVAMRSTNPTKSVALENKINYVVWRDEQLTSRTHKPISFICFFFVGATATATESRLSFGAF